jgi:hypothetical protein
VDKAQRPQVTDLPLINRGLKREVELLWQFNKFANCS